MISNKQKYELYKPKNFLGQNFLVDENIARKIVKSLGINVDDTVIEIGPGHGALTKYLAELTKSLFAIEIDKTAYENLSMRFGKQLNLIHSDFLKYELPDNIRGAAGEIKIIGNIPYNITSGILFKLYQWSELQPGKISTAILMMQREVARRLVSMPGTKDYGILCILTSLHAKAKILFDVPPTAFFPKPKVYSSIVRLDFKNNFFEITDKQFLTMLVKESFGKRRKTMRNSLKSLLENAKINEAEIEFNFSRRPESVSVEEFVLLSNEISKKKTAHSDPLA